MTVASRLEVTKGPDNISDRLIEYLTETTNTPLSLDVLFYEVETAINKAVDGYREWEEQETDEDTVRLAKRRFQDLIAPLFRQSAFMDRALSKPMGYAGDFMLLEMIYNDIAVSDSVLGRLLDRFFLGRKLAVAVKNRKDQMKQILSEEINRRQNMRVLNIACGSSREWAELMDEVDTWQVGLTLYDYDQRALDFSQHRIKEKGLLTEAVKGNVVKMRPDIIDDLGKQDFIYSMGLFDYLPDNVMLRLLPIFYDVLDEGGSLYLSFKNKDNYNRYLYDWLADWQIVSRDQNDVLRLLHKAGLIENLKDIYTEESGVISAYKISKDQETAFRY